MSKAHKKKAHRKNAYKKIALAVCVAAVAGTGYAATAIATPAETKHRPASPKASSVLLDVDYESGTLDSGIPGLTTTHAKADDASKVENGGDGGSSHSVSHKVTLNDPDYVSDGAPRSESANNELQESLIQVGDVHRYEFSVMLKDWEASDGPAGDILFQGKHAGGNKPSFYLMAKRDEIAFRSPLLNLQAPVVADFRDYVNKWMRFRIDVKWTDDNTGYYKVSSQLPGESGYTLKKTYSNVKTFHPENPTTFGYIKWGLYRPASSTDAGDPATRIVRHDDIRVFDLAKS
ncbi:heparin lyase I family protein [Streptomyces sp. NA04227]|uniref:heparin lyase I family protein n=1 Tax=Streptomyces sp. NA04227 TaxID=2742136 RepID=UPI0015909A27|nr:heparin lyase I family protein [Streptomyces sp. NA04227]QKW08683.1 heparin lyase I family protein [Streptomyces sp. NA04227]